MAAKNLLKTRVLDSGARGFRRYHRRLIKAVPQVAVIIGVIEPQPIPGSDLTTGQLMAIHEFGSVTRHIPARPVLRSTLAEQRGEIVEILKQGLISRAWGSGDAGKIRPRRPLIDVGQKLQRAIKAKFGSGRLKRPKPPDENGPLVDTGRLRKSIKYKVIKVKPSEAKP